ncbi:hypothetical protein GCM10023201_23110 [Actinomycetospora corticicola]|uniref:Secreted protein n=1 Tax=Actinomycetospora corticicola TaxID=663602 RepID=A0A7Y9J3E0_9PSEU|nr:hypothetical protein [Actinomycetospora corticicola]NYD33968.1 hypothetical protein [Actinomycetospora corticicola]
MRLLLAVLFIAATASACGSEPPPKVCSDLQGANDITAIAQVVDDVAPGHDYVANELQAEGVVNKSCPDQGYKLQRYREQVINPVVGG